MNLMPEATTSLLSKLSRIGKYQEPNAGDLQSLTVEETGPKSRILIVDDTVVNVVFLKLQLQ